jgi:hypothetical protein
MAVDGMFCLTKRIAVLSLLLLVPSITLSPLPLSHSTFAGQPLGCGNRSMSCPHLPVSYSIPLGSFLTTHCLTVASSPSPLPHTQGCTLLASNPGVANAIAGLACAASYQSGIDRHFLWERRNETVASYDMSVADIVQAISTLRVDLDGPAVGCGGGGSEVVHSESRAGDVGAHVVSRRATSTFL